MPKNSLFVFIEKRVFWGVRLRVADGNISCWWKKRCRISPAVQPISWQTAHTRILTVWAANIYLKRNRKKEKEKKELKKRSRRDDRLRFQINGKPQSQKGLANEYNWISQIKPNFSLCCISSPSCLCFSANTYIDVVIEGIDGNGGGGDCTNQGEKCWQADISSKQQTGMSG